MRSRRRDAAEFRDDTHRGKSRVGTQLIGQLEVVPPRRPPASADGPLISTRPKVGAIADPADVGADCHERCQT